MSRKIRKSGLFILFAIIVFNFYHVLNGYGISSNSMPTVILAQGSLNSLLGSSSSDTKCKQQISTNRVYYPTCNSNDRNSSCDYTITTYSCVKGEGYACKEGTLYTGYSCNENYNSSNGGTLTTKNCN